MKLRNLELVDAYGILSWIKDPEINRFFQIDSNSSNLESVQSFILSSHDQNVNIHQAVVDDEDKYLGTVSLKNINLHAKNAEYAISICRDAHGTGVAKFATNEILKIAFEKLNLNRVYLNVMTENIRANKFYLKCKFIYEGEFKEHLYINGSFKDLTWYRMLKNEYYEINQ